MRQYHERYHWPLAVAIVLLLVEMLFPERKREPKAKTGRLAAARQPAGPAPRQLVARCLLLASAHGRPLGSACQRAAGIQGRQIRPGAQGIRAVAPAQERRPAPPFQRRRRGLPQPAFEEAAKQFNATLDCTRFKTPGPGLLQPRATPFTTSAKAIPTRRSGRRPGRKPSRITKAPEAQPAGCRREIQL